MQFKRLAEGCYRLVATVLVKVSVAETAEGVFVVQGMFGRLSKCSFGGLEVPRLQLTDAFDDLRVVKTNAGQLEGR